MKVLLAHPSPDLYGSDRMLVRSAVACAQAGMDVRVVLPQHGPLESLLAQSDVPTSVVPFPVLRKALQTPRGLLRLGQELGPGLRRLVRLLKAEQPDLVYVNTVTLPVWVAAARLARVRVACHVRELESDLPAAAARTLLSPLLACTALFANSQATADHLTACWPGLRGRTTVLYNGLAFPTEVPEPPPLDGTVTMTVVGRLSPRKGQDVALEALEHLVRNGVDARLRLVGDTFPGYEWFEGQLRERAAAAGLADRVVFDGYRDEVWQVYLESDLVLVPSRLEPFGSVAAEAAAACRPVVVSRVGGLPEIIQDGVTGAVVPRGDADALWRAVQDVVADPARSAGLARAASTDVRARFSEERYAADLVAGVHRAAGRAAVTT